MKVMLIWSTLWTWVFTTTTTDFHIHEFEIEAGDMYLQDEPPNQWRQNSKISHINRKKIRNRIDIKQS